MPHASPLLRASLALAALLALAAPARAATNLREVISVSTTAGTVAQRTWKCTKGNGAACTSSDLANSWYRQVLVLPTGFAETERDAFWADFDRTVQLVTSDASAGSTWAVQKKAQLLFVGAWVGGGALNTSTAAFGAGVQPHPIRGFALSLSQDAVYAQVDALRAAGLPALRPLATAVLFNTFQTPVTANASPPSLVNKPWGVAKYTRQDLRERGAYVPSHELAHAGLNFLDEYVEGGLENLSIKQIDAATPLALFDGSWSGAVRAIDDLLGVYDYNISDILSHNGNDNMSTTRWPTSVYTPGYPAQDYAYEGGMFFGRGTFHQAGSNLMNSNHVMRAWDDGFAFAHSASQQQVVNAAFGGPAGRPNDRLRNAGPKNGWPLALGSTTHVMLFDADKNHHFHPTHQWTVQVGWYDRVWKTCWWGPFPYACYDDIWRTAEKVVSPAWRAVDLKLSSLYGLAKLAQQLACAAGVNEVSSAGGKIRLCDQNLDTMANNFLPTIKFPVPNQDVSVPASQWFTTYWWRFKSDNGTAQSGWTGWSSFYRSF